MGTKGCGIKGRKRGPGSSFHLRGRASRKPGQGASGSRFSDRACAASAKGGARDLSRGRGLRGRAPQPTRPAGPGEVACVVERVERGAQQGWPGAAWSNHLRKAEVEERSGARQARGRRAGGEAGTRPGRARFRPRRQGRTCSSDGVRLTSRKRWPGIGSLVTTTAHECMVAASYQSPGFPVLLISRCRPGARESEGQCPSAGVQRAAPFVPGDDQAAVARVRSAARPAWQQETLVCSGRARAQPRAQAAGEPAGPTSVSAPSRAHHVSLVALLPASDDCFSSANTACSPHQATALGTPSSHTTSACDGFASPFIVS